MDKIGKKEQTEQAIPKRKRTARQHGLRFSGKTSKQFQQEVQKSETAKESSEVRSVSEDQQLPMPDPDSAGLSPREANLRRLDKSQVALSPEISPRPETASRKRRESSVHSTQSDSSWEPEPSVHSTLSDSSWEPEPSAHSTETRPTKKRKAMANQAPSENQPDLEANCSFGEAGPSRPRSYEEWKASQEGKNPCLKPVRSPGRDRDNEQEGQIYGYDMKDFEGFCEKTKMQERPSVDQIKKKQLENLVYGYQAGAGKCERKWTIPDPVIQAKLQVNLGRMRKNNKDNRDKIRDNQDDNEEYLKKRREVNKKTYRKHSRRIIENRIKKCREMKENNPEEHEKRLKRQNELARKKRREMKEKNPKEYKKRLTRENNQGTKKRREMKENNPEEYEKQLSRKKELQKERNRRLKEDFNASKGLLDKRYKKEKEDYEISISQLQEKMKNANSSEKGKLQESEQNLISQWDTFQKQYEADLDKLAQLFQQRELQQSQQYMAIEGELETLIQRYKDKDDKLESHDLEDDLLNEGADLSPHEANRTFGEAESSRPRTYKEWKASEEGQDPDLRPVRSPGGQIYGYDPTDWSDFLEKTKMKERPRKDRIENKRHLSNVVLGRQKVAKNWTNPNQAIERKRQKNADKDRMRRITPKNRTIGSEGHKKRLINEFVNRLMKNEKFYENAKYRKSKLQELMGKPEHCKAFFEAFLKRGYKKKEEQYQTKLSQIDTRMKNANTSQRDGRGTKGESIKRVLQQAKQDLKSQCNNLQERYQADLKKLDELIGELEQLQRVPEQDPSTSERDEPSNQQQDLQQRQQHMEIEEELGALIQRYGSNDDEFDLSKLDELELYDMNNLGERELHNLENDLLNDFADSDDSSGTQSD